MKGLDILFLVLVVTAILLGVTTSLLYSEANRLDSTIVKTKSNMERMNKEFPDVKKLPKIDSVIDPNQVNTFLYDKIKSLGIKTEIPTPFSSKIVGSWQQSDYPIHIKPEQNQIIPRRELVKVLEDIEREVPYLRVKSFNFSLKKDGADGIVTISKFIKKTAP